MDFFYMNIFKLIITCFALFYCFIPNQGFSQVQDHFKLALGKGVNHSIPNVDFIYMINLDERPEKFQTSREKLEPYGIYPYRFSAVNGWHLTLEAINDLGVCYTLAMPKGIMGTCYLPNGNFDAHHEMISKPGRTYFCHCMSRGAIGIVLSHLSILKDAYDSGYETIWVMEDDIEVVRDPLVLSDLIEKLDKCVGKNNWDILFTDQDTRNLSGQYVRCTCAAPRPNYTPDTARLRTTRVINQDFRKIGTRYGAYSMIVRRTGMKKILDFFCKYKLFFPYDMDFCMPNDMQVYTVIEGVVRHVTGGEVISDNGAPNYLSKLIPQ